MEAAPRAIRMGMGVVFAMLVMETVMVTAMVTKARKLVMMMTRMAMLMRTDLYLSYEYVRYCPEDH